MKEGSAEYNSFAETVLNKSDKQLKAYWAKVIFTGQGTPPREVDSAAQMLDLVANNPNLIGFVPAGSVSGAVKWLENSSHFVHPKKIKPYFFGVPIFNCCD